MTDTPQQLRALFDAAHAAARADPTPTWDIRKDRLQRLAAMVHENEDAIAAAINADFGQRARADTELAEFFPSYAEIRHAIHKGRKWARPRRVPTAMWFWPGRSRIVPQPKGLVGIVSPWNYPLFMVTGPLAGAFAAGNRALLKPSEFTPHFSEWLAGAVARHFDPTELAVVRGGPDMGAAFTALPFDHLFFTGNGEIGKKIMAAAAPNLTPVTLELGGKSPVIVTAKADLDRAVARVMTGKMMNAGQTCVAPDHVYIARPLMDDFITRSRAWVGRHYPDIATNPDFTRIIDARQFDRLTAMRDQADGATWHKLTEAEPNANSRLFPPVIVTGAQPDSDLMTREIFGPILPVIPFDDPDEAVAAITARPRPLAAYYFSEDRAEIDALQARIISGGACYNETVMHVAQANLPFGGVGGSGMGAYHGQHGFDTFSHLRGTFIQPRLNGMGMLAPPFGPRFTRMIGMLKSLTRP